MNVFLRSASVLAFAACALAAHAQFNSNLVVNPGAESGTGSSDGQSVVPVPGWTTTGNATAVVYGAGGAGAYPSLSDPGPANRGVNFFSGGPNNVASSLSQTIALGFGTSTIDAGLASYGLSAYLGGYQTQNDNTIVIATFLNGLGASLGTATLGPVTAADRGNATGLLLRSTSGVVPVGARSVSLALNFARTDGAYDDGYADNVSLVLTQPTPEPSVIAALGLGAVAVLRRRKRA